MHVKAERRFASGLSYLVSYTWSKSIDVASSAQYRESLSLPNPYDPNSSRSVSSFDDPHLFSGAFVYELPFGPGRRWASSGIGSKILGNWKVNMIMNLRSGQPFTPIMNVDVANIGSPNRATRARPDLVGNPEVSNRGPAAWFNKAAFASPAQFTYGTAGRNILRTDVTDARLSVGGVDVTLPVSPDAAEVKFRVPLEAGEARLQAWFIHGLNNGATHGAYYVGVKRLSR